MAPEAPGRTLLFVYNADLSVVGLLSDFAHRTLSPETYGCRLCHVSYDRFTMKRAWKDFIATLPCAARFELRNRFRRRHPEHADAPLPAIFWLRAAATPQVVVTSEELRAVDHLGQLEAIVRRIVDAEPLER